MPKAEYGRLAKCKEEIYISEVRIFLLVCNLYVCTFHSEQGEYSYQQIGRGWWKNEPKHNTKSAFTEMLNMP